MSTVLFTVDGLIKYNCTFNALRSSAFLKQGHKLNEMLKEHFSNPAIRTLSKESSNVSNLKSVENQEYVTPTCKIFIVSDTPLKMTEKRSSKAACKTDCPNAIYFNIQDLNVCLHCTEYEDRMYFSLKDVTKLISFCSEWDRRAKFRKICNFKEKLERQQSFLIQLCLPCKDKI